MLTISRPIAVECSYMLGSFAAGSTLPLTRANVPTKTQKRKTSLTSRWSQRPSASKKGKGGVATCPTPILVRCEALEAKATPPFDSFSDAPRAAPSPPLAPSPLVRQAIRAVMEWDSDLAEDSFWADI
ncbi:hypothetical protein HWV62_22592 [Athelia sp. TMB]|nr:hypothetical protein HWV62_22592 [Athelia sp. TMB]